MTNDLIPAPRHERHRCSLGGTSWALGEVGIGGLSRCSTCGRWWHLTDWTLNDTEVVRWAPVRWYHFRLRSRITTHQATR